MEEQILKVGCFSALAAFVATLGYGIVQILQLLQVTCYPIDDILIYAFSLAISLPFLLSILVFHYTIAVGGRFWSHGALLFALMYAVYVVLMYTVQLATVIPQSMRGSPPNILVVTPHSFFWTLDALGYICMGICTLFAGFALEKNPRQVWLKRFLFANAAVVPLISISYFYPNYSTVVLFIGAPWLITAPGSMLMLAGYFRRTMDLIISR